MKKILIAVGVLLAASLVLAVWFLWTPCAFMTSVTISDVRRANTLVLGKETGNARTHAIIICGSGEIEGEATISLMLDDKPYKVEKLSGKVEFEWGGDWYSETAEIQYEPGNVRSGKVVLHYRFHQFHQ